MEEKAHSEDKTYQNKSLYVQNCEHIYLKYDPSQQPKLNRIYCFPQEAIKSAGSIGKFYSKLFFIL